jgi:hypothetical protein
MSAKFLVEGLAAAAGYAVEKCVETVRMIAVDGVAQLVEDDVLSQVGGQRGQR